MGMLGRSTQQNPQPIQVRDEEAQGGSLEVLGIWIYWAELAVSVAGSMTGDCGITSSAETWRGEHFDEPKSCVIEDGRQWTSID
jgi:hypothetical protein